jgi:hypothetical protein
MGRHKRDGEAVDSLMSFIRRWCLRAPGYGQKQRIKNDQTSYLPDSAWRNEWRNVKSDCGFNLNPSSDFEDEADRITHVSSGLLEFRPNARRKFWVYSDGFPFSQCSGGAWGERQYSYYSFSTSALDGGEWSASRPGHALAPGKWPPVPIGQEAEWAPEAQRDTEARGKILLPLPGIEPQSPGRPVRSQTLYWLSYPGFY